MTLITVTRIDDDEANPGSVLRPLRCCTRLTDELASLSARPQQEQK